MSFDYEDPRTSELPHMTNGKNCIVCSDKSDGFHFGTESCRACAAFFRRSIVSGKKYVCRHGPAPCDINKNGRCMCRKCRFDKCYLMGMRKEMVQGRRDPIIPKIKDPEPLCATPSTSKVTLCSSDTKNILFRPNIKAEFLEEPKLLLKIYTNYKELCAKRRATELSMDPTFSARMNTYGPLTGYAIGDHNTFATYGKAHMPTVWEFVSSTFEEFSQLSPDDKWDLFQSFLVLLWGMDKNYQTFKKVAKEHYSKILIMSETLYFDIDRMGEWFSHIESQRNPKDVQNDLQSVIQQCMTKSRQRVLYGMCDMQIMDEEYAALIGLMLWNQNFEKNNEHVDLLAKTMREKIFEDLHLFYRSKQITKYAQRLGELMGLHSTVLIDVLRFREDMELFNLLEAFQKDDFFYKMIRNSRCF